MYSSLLVIFGFSMLCGGSRYGSSDYRKRIVLESALFPSSPVSRIIGGEKATIEEYPFAVSLQNNGTFFGHEVEHFCGGSIIGEKWIITSAQCALRIHLRSFHVRAGTSDYYKNGDIYDVKNVIVHPMFNAISYDYDIGLVELAENVKYDRTKQPIKIPKMRTTIESGSVVRVLGWGATMLQGSISDELRQNTAYAIDNEHCSEVNGGDVVTQQMFCVASDTVHPCIGDSGSPVVGNDTLLGVASWTRSCVYKYPTAYAALSEVTNWITEITGVA